VNVPAAGGLVKKGQLLAEIYSPELLQELLELRASISLEWKQAAIARAKAQGASDALIQEVLDGKEPSAKFKLYAPANGVVRLKATEGSWLAPGSVIASLEAPDQLSARMTVAGRLPLPGTEVSLKALNGSSMASAKVAEVLQQGSAAGREVQLKLNTSIPVGIPLIGEWEEILNGLWVPVGALVDTGVRKIVFVESPMGFLPAPVEVGLSTGAEVEILKGLTGTERVAASAAFLLDSETQTGSVSHAGHGG
jgi:multidrug efflux pump subunit AcrA (membrane-fusion protein)